jgi:hypothetical protein
MILSWNARASLDWSAIHPLRFLYSQKMDCSIRSKVRSRRNHNLPLLSIPHFAEAAEARDDLDQKHQ